MSALPDSLWVATSGDDWTPRPTLAERPVRSEVDVAIVGGGFTGLWTARYLLDAEPTLSVLVIEREVCGFGASGRNGGWCSALFPSAEATPAMRAAMNASVDEVGRAAAADGIDCDWAKGGMLFAATSPAHLDRLRVDDSHDPDATWLDAPAATARLRAAGMLGASYNPNCAAIHPAKLVRGLARSVEARGGHIVEGTRVTAIEPGTVHTDLGTVRARHVLRCTEGYTPELAGHRRTVIPVYSLIVATEPLPETTWASIGLADREVFSDGRHLLIYGQRTADGRLAFGGRGAPYHFGSRVDPSFDVDERVFVELERTLRRLLPQLGAARITHRWGGPLAVPRDWWASVGHDPATGLGWAGGYVGDGVSTTNLAGRTLCDLVLGRTTDLTSLPWVGHRSRQWEPEPLRWFGVNVGRGLAAGADRHESRTGRPDRLRSRLMSLFTGGH